MSKQEDSSLELRVLALENEIRTIHSQLADIRDIISQAFDTLSDANHNRSQAINFLAHHIEQIEERLDPIFNKTFPNHADFINETQVIFDSTHKPQS